MGRVFQKQLLLIKSSLQRLATVFADHRRCINHRVGRDEIHGSQQRVGQRNNRKQQRDSHLPPQSIKAKGPSKSDRSLFEAVETILRKRERNRTFLIASFSASLSSEKTSQSHRSQRVMITFWQVS
jgi:hypothetical protein